MKQIIRFRVRLEVARWKTRWYAFKLYQVQNRLGHPGEQASDLVLAQKLGHDIRNQMAVVEGYKDLIARRLTRTSCHGLLKA